jgi:hypothetical protein
MTHQSSVQNQTDRISPTEYVSVIWRLLLIGQVGLALLVWPEPLDPTTMLLAISLSAVVATLGSVDFCKTFLYSFLVATMMAFVVYGLLTPLGLFDTAWQEPLATDSQFFLHESRRFLLEDDSSALFTAWGSLVPVLYGAIAQKAFNGNYLGIVFVNCLLYTATVFWAARILEMHRHWYRFLPLLGLLPLQGFYNSMLAKEPIYLFLTIGALHAYKYAVMSDRFSWKYFCVFTGLTILLIIFRPTGALLLGLVALINVAMRSGLVRASVFFVVFASILLLAITLASYIDYFLPLFFVGSEGDVDITTQLNFSIDSMASKLIPESIAPLFLPPLSLILSPLLGLLWMVSPLPIVDQFINSFQSLFTGAFSFTDLTIIIRYLDSIIIVLMLFLLLRARIIKFVMLNPLVLFGVFQILTTVAFQFFESGRHRYLPGFILAMMVVMFIGRKNADKPFYNN